MVLPLNRDETEFLRQLNEDGAIVAGLLTSDADMAEIIWQHPGLRWKALNVRRHAGLPSADEG